MSTLVVGLASRTESLTYDDIAPVAEAIDQQVRNEFGDAWSIDGSVIALKDPDGIQDGVMPVYIVEGGLPRDLVGLHHAGDSKASQKLPYANVLHTDLWSMTASHEVLEMLVDQNGDRFQTGREVSIDPGTGRIVDLPNKVEYLVEICDPVQSQACAYSIGNDVVLSDFYGPGYFSDAPTGPGPYFSQSKALKFPRRVLNGGYLTWKDANSQYFQLSVDGGSCTIEALKLPRGISTDAASTYAASRPIRGQIDYISRGRNRNATRRLLGGGHPGKLYERHWNAVAGLLGIGGSGARAGAAAGRKRGGARRRGRTR